MNFIFKIVFLIISILSWPLHAEIVVIDDVAQRIVLNQPAERIISLAPHTTELLYSAGATNQIIGTVSFSDYPEQAKKIKLIGSSNKFDLESIVALKPDLIIAWKSGNTMARIEEVRSLGFPVFINEPREFADISETLVKLGVLLGTEKTAETHARQFNESISKLQIENKDKLSVRVFYQVWDDPLFTINGEHLISKVIKLCGGVNIFESVSALSPQIGVEAVLESNPEVIVAGTNESRSHWLAEWQKWTGMTAVKQQHLYAINADLIVRHTPRIVLGAQRMCEILDKVRKKSNSI